MWTLKYPVHVVYTKKTLLLLFVFFNATRRQTCFRPFACLKSRGCAQHAQTPFGLVTPLVALLWQNSRYCLNRCRSLSSLDALLPSKFHFVLCRNNGVKLRSFAILFASVFGAVWFRREDPKWRQLFLFQSSINPIRALKHRLGACLPGLSDRVTTCAPKEHEEIR